MILICKDNFNFPEIEIGKMYECIYSRIGDYIYVIRYKDNNSNDYKLFYDNQVLFPVRLFWTKEEWRDRQLESLLKD